MIGMPVFVSYMTLNTYVLWELRPTLRRRDVIKTPRLDTG